MGRREREAKRLKGGDEQGQAFNAQLLALQRLTQAGPRMVGHYSSQHRILLVGEGDFTFGRALASAVGGEKLVCTSLGTSQSSRSTAPHQCPPRLATMPASNSAISTWQTRPPSCKSNTTTRSTECWARCRALGPQYITALTVSLAQRVVVCHCYSRTDRLDGCCLA
jgi:hypothetical protein